MKLKGYTFVLLSSFLICSCSQQQNDLKGSEVSGKVKSVHTTGYKAVEKFGEITEGVIDYINDLVEFNQEGFIISYSSLNNNGTLFSKSVYYFDDNGNRTKMRIYNEDGEEIGRSICTYNSDNKISKIVEYDQSGKVKSTQKYEWDGDNLIKSQYFSKYSDGDYCLYEYDGKMVKSVEYDKSGKPTGEYTEFDDERIVKHVYRDFTSTVKYNDKGLCKSIENGQLYSTNSYTWSKGESYNYEYEYDKRGNWIRKVETNAQTEKAERIFVREIEYY